MAPMTSRRATMWPGTPGLNSTFSDSHSIHFSPFHPFVFLPCYSLILFFISSSPSFVKNCAARVRQIFWHLFFRVIANLSWPYFSPAFLLFFTPFTSLRYPLFPHWISVKCLFREVSRRFSVFVARKYRGKERAWLQNRKRGQGIYRPREIFPLHIKIIPFSFVFFTMFSQPQICPFFSQSCEYRSIFFSALFPFVKLQNGLALVYAFHGGQFPLRVSCARLPIYVDTSTSRAKGKEERCCARRARGSRILIPACVYSRPFCFHWFHANFPFFALSNVTQFSFDRPIQILLFPAYFSNSLAK